MHLRRSDVLLAIALAALTETILLLAPISTADGGARDPDGLAVVLTLVMVLPVATRRAAPLASLGVAGLAALASTALGYDFSSAQLVVWLMLGWVALRTDRPTSIAVGAIGAASVCVSVWSFLGSEDRSPFELVLAAGVGAMPPIVGDAMRRQRALTEEVRRLRDAELERAVGAERLRIARDVHDTVGHHLGAISLQARAGQLAEPGAALGAIARLSERALDDTQQILGLLRADEPDGLRPTPGLGDVAELAESAALAGVEVRVAVEARTDDLPDLVSTCGYRIVQEALTNAARHAAPARAELSVRRAGGRVTITVTDDGARRRAPGTRSGHGIAGMRERAQAIGGTVLVAPLSPSGWRVHAELPDAL